MGKLNVQQAADRLKRHPELVRRWLREGLLKGETVGEGRRAIWFVDERELVRFRRSEPGRRSRE